MVRLSGVEIGKVESALPQRQSGEWSKQEGMDFAAMVVYWSFLGQQYGMNVANGLSHMQSWA